ncbi:MAG: membrane protein insertase YidC [Spirochaetaceae bacterium]|nr:membrane protein insertase YidC [Spirochaetaceae bacterium]
MDRRTLIAVGLSVVVIVGSLLVQTFLFPAPDGALGLGAPTAARAPAAGEDAAAASAGPDVFAPVASAVAAAGEDSAVGARLIVKETDLFSLAFTTAGGDLTSIRLKQHHDVDGTEVELVLRPEQHRLFTVAFGGFRTEPVDATFSFQEVDQYTWRFTRDFEAEDGVPFTLAKTYTFPPNSYLFELEIDIENSANALPALNFQGSSYTLGIGPQIGPEYETLDGRNEFRNFRNYVDGKARNQRMRREAVLAEAKRVNWTAIAGKYFAIIAVPDATLYTITYDKRKDPELGERTALYFSRPLITSSRNSDTFRFYAGPLKREILNRYNNAAADPFAIGNYHFEEAARTNPIIGWLANILRFFLDFFYRLIPNYGVAIILLTVLIKILFFPLTQKSFESTSKMSMLGPKIEEIKKKYQGKPEKLNQEMMALYRKEGVNPVGGCLPLLLQMPIFFALFELLNNAFDLRGAPFISPWIGDLSAPESFLPFGFTLPLLNWDELRILPFVMLGTTLLQSRISQNPSAMQPQMKMMMYAMPIFFFFILYSMPSGLVIYWTMQNVLSIAQQLYINDRRRRAGPDAGTPGKGRGPRGKSR